MSLSTTERRRNNLDFYDTTSDTIDEYLFEEKDSFENMNEVKHTALPRPPSKLQEYLDSNLTLQEDLKPCLNFHAPSSRPEIIAFEDIDCDEDNRDLSFALNTEIDPADASGGFASISDRDGRRAASYDGTKERIYDSFPSEYISTRDDGSFSPSHPEGGNDSTEGKHTSPIFKPKAIPTEELNLKRLSSGNTFTTTASTLSLSDQALIDTSLHLYERSASPTSPSSETITLLSASPTEKVTITKSSKVHFGTISIRGYNRILGDNPSCSAGPSLSIGWTFISEVDQMCVDKYETIRRDSRVTQKSDLVLSRAERDTILKDLGYSRAEMAAAVRQNVKIKSQRRRTVLNLQYSNFEEKSESVVRKMKKLFKRVPRLRKK